MRKLPFVSVVMSVYNGERYLRESVNSVLNQTWRDFELIIINDGSTDETAELLATIDDPRVLVIENKSNQGLVRSLNLGLERARGEYVARHDADDVALPQRLERQAQFLNSHSDVSIVGSGYIEIDESGKRRKRVRMPEEVLMLRWHALFQNPFAHSTVMFRRASVMEMGGYAGQTEASHVEDYELWLRLMWSGQLMVNIAEPLVHWRSNPEGVSKTFASQQGENFRAIVRTNLRKLGRTLRDDESLSDLVWRLQVCGGFDEPLEQVEKALKALEELVKNFCEHFQLGARQQRRVRQIARRRTARSLLHNAQQYSYAGRVTEANEFARLALSLDKRLALSGGYRKLRVKSLLGQSSSERLQDAQKRIRRAIHLS